MNSRTSAIAAVLLFLAVSASFGNGAGALKCNVNKNIATFAETKLNVPVESDLELHSNDPLSKSTTRPFTVCFVTYTKCLVSTKDLMKCTDAEVKAGAYKGTYFYGYTAPLTIDKCALTQANYTGSMTANTVVVCCDTDGCNKLSTVTPSGAGSTTPTAAKKSSTTATSEFSMWLAVVLAAATVMMTYIA